MHDYIIYFNGSRVSVSGASAHEAISEILGPAACLNLIKLLRDLTPPYNPLYLYEHIGPKDKRAFICAEKIS